MALHRVVTLQMNSISKLLKVSAIIMAQSIFVTPAILVAFNLLIVDRMPKTELREWSAAILLILYLLLIRVQYRKRVFSRNAFKICGINIGNKVGILMVVVPVVITAICYSIYESMLGAFWEVHINVLYGYFDTFSKIEFRAPIYVSVILYVTWWNTRRVASNSM